MNLDHVLLQAEQKELLEILVEASRNVSKDKRHKFILSQSVSGNSLTHNGLDAKNKKTYIGDIEALERENMIISSYNNNGDLIFDVSPQGYRYYGYLKLNSEQATDAVVGSIVKYIDSEKFRKSYPRAFEKWSDACEILWGFEVEKELTTIGHLCRESLQEFADSLVIEHLPNQKFEDKAKTVMRIKAVLLSKKSRMGNTKTSFLDALLPYWGTVSDLVQKQEHGAQTDREKLTWEDARLVVFQCMIVMYEVDRAIGSA